MQCGCKTFVLGNIERYQKDVGGKKVQKLDKTVNFLGRNNQWRVKKKFGEYDGDPKKNNRRLKCYHLFAIIYYTNTIF